MTSQGGEHISEEKEEENFYDCQEIIELPDGSGGVGEVQEKRGSSEDLNIATSRLSDARLGVQEEEQVNGLQEEPLKKLQEEGEPVNKVQEDQEQDNAPLDDVDSELKENGKEVEFDDEYLREVEKELTEEEKEVMPSFSNLFFFTSEKNIKWANYNLDNVLKYCYFFLFQSRRQQSLALKEKGNRQFKDGSK